MKRIYTILVPIAIGILLTATVCLPRQVKAQSPEKMSYQAVIRNASDQLVTNQDIGMQISILQGSASGTAVYIETHSTTSNANGLVTIEIGTGTTSDDFSVIDWATGPYFIKTETDPTAAGGTDYTITGISQLLSVSYALHAKTVEIEVDGSITNELQNLTLNGTTLEISDGTNADLSSLQDGTGTDDQTLAEVLAESNFANAQIKNVTDPTDEKDVATKAYVDSLEQQIEAMQNFLISAGSIVKDYDGNVYGIVSIGTQKWMTENLKTTKYNDGTAIPLVTDNTAWSNLTDSAYCWYNNDEATYKNTYGALYNWYTVNAGNLCPTGWHVPTDAEWTVLTDYLGGASIAGGKLKETGTTHWNTPNTGATNETSFTALPGGSRSGVFSNIGHDGHWWSATENGSTVAFLNHLVHDAPNAYLDITDKDRGFSVRCLQD